MAKTKQKKKKSNKNTVDSEILRYVIALAAITVTLIAALQLGIVGQFLTTITRYLFGTYYGVVYGLCLLGGLAVLFGQKFPVFSVKTLIAIGAVLVAMILWSAIPQDPQLSGFQVFSEYLSHTGEHFSSPSTVAAQGGVLGALLYSLSFAVVCPHRHGAGDFRAAGAGRAADDQDRGLCVAVAVAHRGFAS